MKKIIYTLLIFVSIIQFAQSQNNNEGDSSYLPNVTPPSPEAFGIIEYGKNEIVESSGKLQINLPLYNYTAGQLSLPLSIGYSGAGVKVNDISSWVGMNWTLIAGGVITRQARDFADESILNQRVFINRQDLLDNTSNTCSPNSQFYYNLCEYKDNYDTEVDLFNFSFNGYSGSFYLDANFNPIYIENESELKIGILGNYTDQAKNLRETKTFCITTPDGIKYYFGGNETEETMAVSGHRNGSFPVNTTFNLYRIVHPNNGEIILEYKTLSPKLSLMSKSYNMRTTALTTNQYVPSYTSQIFKTQINNPKYLFKIKSLNNSEEIIFNSTDYSNHNFTNVLNSIEIKKGVTQTKQINFVYGAKSSANQAGNNFETSSRFFLEKVEINKNFDSTGNKYEEYSMVYDDPFGLPVRLSNSQDIKGYFNGQTNETLIPDHPAFNGVNSPFYANRHPYFNLAKKGSLKKIIYPTKGYSEFEYEPTPAKEKEYKIYQGYVHSNPSIGDSTVQFPGYNDFIGEFVDLDPIYKTQKVSLKLDILSSNYNIDKNQRVRLKISNVTTNALPMIIEKQLGATNHATVIYEYEFIKDNEYQIELTILQNLTTQTTTLSAALKFSLMTGYVPVGGFGVRIKRQKDYDNLNNITSNIKRYYYGRIDGSDLNFLIHPEINYFPKYTYEYGSGGFTGVINEPSTSADMYGVYINIFSEPMNKYNGLFDGEFYDVVSTSFGGDNFENGGVEKYFLSQHNYPIERIKVTNDGCFVSFLYPDGTLDFEGVHCGPPSTAPTGITFVRENARSFEISDMSMFNGTLFHERVYKKENGTLFKVSEKTYNYYISINPSLQATNFVGRTLFGYEAVGVYCTIDFSDQERKPLSSCYMGYYETNVFSKKLLSITDKNYIEGVPLSLYSPFVESEVILGYVPNPNIDIIEQPFKKMITTQEYEYGNLKGLPTQITSSTSEGSKVIKTTNKYVNDYMSLNGLTNIQSDAYSNLLNLNNISSPVETKQFENNQLLSTKRILFKTIDQVNGVPKVVVEEIQASKENQPLEKRAVFYNYDTNYNPAVIGLVDGPKTRYIYNNEGLVVAKIENYTGADTIFPIVTGNLDNSNCSLQNFYTNSLVTVYHYDLTINKLIKITNANCIDTYYEYDSLHRLKYIKDHDGNILQEFDTNFKSN
jgi:YD repeat-containing protein